MLPYLNRLVAFLGLTVSVSQPALAETPETCLISPNPPAFASDNTETPLHALPHPQAGVHTQFHGQGLYGTDTLYFSHLAVFMGQPEAHPHNFQVILEVEFEDSEAKQQYQTDKARHQNVIYTAVPPIFDLTALVTEYPGRSRLEHFPATTVIRGHFEQGGSPILEDVPVKIKRVIYFREFLLGGAHLKGQHYLLFGRSEDIFLSHLLSAPPDFDQILAIAFEAKDIPTEVLREKVKNLLAQGLYVHLPSRENSVATRLRTADTLICSLETGTRAQPITVELRIRAESYCEAGEFVRLVTTQFNPPQRCQG